LTWISCKSEIESICRLISQKHANVTQIVPNSHTSNPIAFLLWFYAVFVMLYDHKASIRWKSVILSNGFHVKRKLTRFVGIFRKNMQMLPKSTQFHIRVFDERTSYCRMEALDPKFNVNWHGFHVKVKLSRFVGIFRKNMQMIPKSSQIHIWEIGFCFSYVFTLYV
jgi:hypothetical protein